MTFPQLPVFYGRPDWPVKRKPRASTLVQKAISGRVTDQPLWNTPIYDYELSYSVLNMSATSVRALSASEWQQYEDFWKIVKFGTQAYPNRFTFDDINDDSVNNQSFATGDGGTTAFQLTRTLSSFTEPVLVPVCGPNTPTVFLDYGNCTIGVTQSLDYGNCTVLPTVWIDYGFCSTLQIFEGSFAIDPTTPLALYTWANGSANASGGVIIIVPAPGNGVQLHWTGNYLWLCRFQEDELQESNFFYRLTSLGKVSFENNYSLGDSDGYDTASTSPRHDD